MTAYATQSTVIRRGGDESPTVYTAIPQCVNINGPTASANEIDVTNLASSAKEYVTGLVDYGQVTFDLILDRNNAIHSGLKNDLDNNTIRSYQIETPDGVVESFEARVSGLDQNINTDDAVKASVTLRLTGPSVWA